MQPDTERGSQSLTERAVRAFIDPARRVQVLMVLSYVFAGLGVGIGFYEGFDRAMGPLAAVGIAMLGISFLLLFYVSVTILALRK